MPLTAYFGLEAVYAFHETAEWWTLRRYAPGVTVSPAGDRVRPGYVEAAVQVFRDPRSKRTANADGGQVDNDHCTVYLRTQLRTAARDDGPQQTDVLFDATGAAWQCVGQSNNWTDARGCESTLVGCGKRGLPPWD